MTGQIVLVRLAEACTLRPRCLVYSGVYVCSVHALINWISLDTYIYLLVYVQGCVMNALRIYYFNYMNEAYHNVCRETFFVSLALCPCIFEIRLRLPWPIFLFPSCNYPCTSFSPKLSARAWTESSAAYVYSTHWRSVTRALSETGEIVPLCVEWICVMCKKPM